MEKSFVFFMLFLLVEWEVGATAPQNQRNPENTNSLAKGERQHKKFYDENLYKEGSTKWNIDLGDMLHFDRLKVKSTIDVKRVSKDELERPRVVREHRGKNEDKEAAEEATENDVYEENEEDINSPMDQDDYYDEDFKIHIQEYIIRYLNLFLSLLNLQDRKALGESDEEIDFTFVIAAKDLKTLKDLSKDQKEYNIYDQLYLIDSIISKGIRVKEKYSFYQDIMKLISKSAFSTEMFISKTSYLYVFLGVGATMLLAKTVINISYKLIAFIFVNNMILMEGLFNYFRKVKEANIADYVERMQYGTEYDPCGSGSLSVFGKLYSMFYDNQCLTYHKNMQIRRADSIFPLESILNAYAFYFVEVPFRILGSAINAFVVNVNAYLPAVVRQFGEVTTQFCVIGLLLLGFIILFATPRFTITLLGARLRINFGRYIQRPEEVPRNPRLYRRIRPMPRPALNVTVRNNEEQPIDHPVEGSDPVPEECECHVEEERMTVEEIEGSSNEEDIEVLDEEHGTDNESPATDEKNSSEDVKTGEGLLDELKTDE